MSRTSWGESSGGAAQRRLRRTVGLAVLVGLVGLVVLIGLKLGLQERTGDSWLERGTASLERALATGDAAAWEEAEASFRHANGSGALLDPYPIFCLSQTIRLREEARRGAFAPDIPPNDLKDIDHLLLLHRPAEAREGLVQLSIGAEGPERTRPELYLRLVVGLEVAARRASNGAPASMPPAAGGQ